MAPAGKRRPHPPCSLEAGEGNRPRLVPAAGDGVPLCLPRWSKIGACRRAPIGLVKIAMPCRDPEYHKELKRDRYHERYHHEKGFAKKESERKADWYQKNRARLLAKAAARKAALKRAAARKKTARKKAA